MDYAFWLIEMNVENRQIMMDGNVFLLNPPRPYVRGNRLISYGRTRQEALQNTETKWRDDE